MQIAQNAACRALQTCRESRFGQTAILENACPNRSALASQIDTKITKSIEPEMRGRALSHENSTISFREGS
jgi:hypothetical protein